MAPPGNRRPGNSRRAQYTTFFGYVAAVAGVFVGGVLLLASAHDGGAFAGLRTRAADAVAPPAQVAARGRTEGVGVYSAVAGFFTSGQRVARLEREVELARVRQVEATALAEENRRLKAMLGIANGDPRPVTVALLIGSTAASSRRFALLGAGSDQGVQVGMPVRSSLALVGRVLEVGRRSARVLLITDGESVVPVRRASDGLPAFATGRADGTLQLRLINMGINTLRKGDAFVTSGSGGLYRPGIAIAVVDQPTHDGAIAQPLGDPGSAEFVAVDPMWVDPVKTPDPPLPAPSPASTKP